MNAFAVCALAYRQHRPNNRAADPALHTAAAAADDLRTARRTLRRTRGCEPSVLDAAAYAAASDGNVDPDPALWLRVFAARNEITEKWMWLVEVIARRLYSSYVRAARSPAPTLALPDMVQEGVCGLMTAAERYDPGRSPTQSFEQYAYFNIKHAIIRAIENQGRPVRLPVHVHNKLARLRKARRRLEETALTAGYNPTVDDVASEAGLSAADALLYLSRSRATHSLDAPLSTRAAADATLLDFLADPSADIERQIEIAYAREALSHIVRDAGLEELELSVLTLKYGLADGVERLRSDVSRILEINGARVRRVELRALNKLRTSMSGDQSVWKDLLM